MVTPVPPAEQATGSTAALLHAQLMRLRCSHELDVIAVAGPDPHELAALDTLAAAGIGVHAVRRSVPRGLARWRRRGRFAWQWLGRRLPFRTVWFWDGSLQALLDATIAAHPPDLILVEDNAMGVYRYPAGSLTVFTEHEVRQPRPARLPSGWGVDLARGVLRERDWQHWATYQPSVWRHFRHIQVFTARDARAMAALAPDLTARIAVNPFGVPVPAAPPAGGEQPESLVFVANFTHQPNVDAALWLVGEIMPLLRRKIPGVRLTLAGSAPPEPVRALAGDDITVTGWVPEIEPYLHRAAVVMAPVRTGGGMRAKVVQGMALGKPVVTTSRGVEGVGCPGEVLPLRVADDAPAIAAVTAALLASPRARHDLGRRAHAYAARHLSVDAYLRRLEARLGPLLPERLCP